jgi:hypothetical protein
MMRSPRRESARSGAETSRSGREESRGDHDRIDCAGLGFGAATLHPHLTISTPGQPPGNRGWGARGPKEKAYRAFSQHPGGPKGCGGR